MSVKGAFAGVAVFLMIAVVFNGSVVEAGGQDWDIVEDYAGYLHGTYSDARGDVFYADNVGQTQRKAFPLWNTPVRLCDTPFQSTYPRITIDATSDLMYVVWIEECTPTTFMMTASADGVSWTYPLACGYIPVISGDPVLDLSASSGKLTITWKQSGMLTVEADSDADMIPDALDENPLEFDWASPVSGEPDLISADVTNGIVIAADVTESDGLRINIEEVAVDMPLPGWPETAFEVDILNATGAVIHPVNCTIQLMFELSKIYTILPDHPVDIRVYRLDEDGWNIVAAWAFNEKTGYFDSRSIVWAITDHLSVFSLGDYTLIDSDSDSFLDSQEMDRGQYPSKIISTFASGISSTTLTIPSSNSFTGSQSISLPIRIPSTTESLVFVESAEMELSIDQPVEIVSSDSVEVTNSFIRLASLDGIPILFSLDSSNGTIEYRLNDGSGWVKPTTIGTYGPEVYYFAVGTYDQSISLVFVQQEKYYYSTSSGGESISAASYYYRDIVNIIHSEDGGINWTEPVALISSYHLFGGLYPSVLVSYNETLIVFDAQLYEQPDGPTPPVLQLRGITVAFYDNGTLSYSQVMNYTLGISYHGIPKFDNQGDFISLVWLNDNGDGSVSLLSTEMTDFGWHWDETPETITTFSGTVEDIFDMDRMDDSVFTAWIDNNEILISQKYSDSIWSETIPIYYSGNVLTKPTCNILENGTALISWWEETYIESLMIGVVDFQGNWLKSPIVSATRPISDAVTETLICKNGDILFSWSSCTSVWLTDTSVSSIVINIDTKTIVDVDGDGLADMELTDYSATTDLVQHIRTAVTKTTVVNGSVTLPFIIISTPGTSISVDSMSLSTIAIQTNPCDVDSDDDTFTDSIDMIAGGSPTPFIESDNDGLDDRTEVLGLGINATVGIEYQQVNIRSTPSTIPFLDDYFNPVVIVIPEESTLPPSCYRSRITSLANNSVTIVSELWDSSSQPEFDAIMYVAEGGAMNLPSGGMVVADEEKISGVGWHHIRFVVPFISAPTVYCSVLSNNVPTPVCAEVKDISRYGFEVCLEENEQEVDAGNTHTFREIIGFIAIENGYSLTGDLDHNILFSSSSGTTIQTVYPSDPNNPDDDYDGWLDNDEINIYKTFPTNSDTDGDTINDGFSSGTTYRDNNPLWDMWTTFRLHCLTLKNPQIHRSMTISITFNNLVHTITTSDYTISDSNIEDNTNDCTRYYVFSISVTETTTLGATNNLLINKKLTYDTLSAKWVKYSLSTSALLDSFYPTEDPSDNGYGFYENSKLRLWFSITQTDIDNDQIPYIYDIFHVNNGGAPDYNCRRINFGNDDYDNDGFTNSQELFEKTNPIMDDTDHDGYSDREEYDLKHQNPSRWSFLSPYMSDRPTSGFSYRVINVYSDHIETKVRRHLAGSGLNTGEIIADDIAIPTVSNGYDLTAMCIKYPTYSEPEIIDMTQTSQFILFHSTSVELKDVVIQFNGVLYNCNAVADSPVNNLVRVTCTITSLPAPEGLYNIRLRTTLFKHHWSFKSLYLRSVTTPDLSNGGCVKIVEITDLHIGGGDFPDCVQVSTESELISLNPHASATITFYESPTKNTGKLISILDRIIYEKPDFIVIGGDITGGHVPTQDHHDLEYIAFQQVMYQNLKNPAFIVPGNHDYLHPSKITITIYAEAEISIIPPDIDFDKDIDVSLTSDFTVAGDGSLYIKYIGGNFDSQNLGHAAESAPYFDKYINFAGTNFIFFDSGPASEVYFGTGPTADENSYEDIVTAAWDLLGLNTWDAIVTLLTNPTALVDQLLGVPSVLKTYLRDFTPCLTGLTEAKILWMNTLISNNDVETYLFDHAPIVFGTIGKTTHTDDYGVDMDKELIKWVEGEKYGSDNFGTQVRGIFSGHSHVNRIYYNVNTALNIYGNAQNAQNWYYNSKSTAYNDKYENYFSLNINVQERPYYVETTSI